MLPDETAVETPPAGAGKEAAAPGGKPDAGAEGKSPAPTTSGNRWTDMHADIAELGKVKDLGELATTKPEGEGKPDGKGAEKPDAEGGERPAGEKKDEAAAAEGEKPAGEEEKDEGKEAEGEQPEQPAARYSVVDAEGAEFEFEALPKGAKIVFQADGKRLEVTSMNDLVTLAQQGAALRKVEGTYQRKLSTHAQTIRTLTSRLEAADRAFREIVDSDEKLEEFRARAKKLTDPDYREGLEAKRKLEVRERQDAEQGEEQRAELVEQFWDEARNHYEAKLAEFPLLEAEDYPDVVRAYWGNFTAHREGLLAEATERAGRGLTPEELEAVDAQAVSWLTEDHLEATMRGLHEKIERRSGRTGGGKRQETDEEKARREADAHNKHVDDKLRQRDTRTLRSSGAPPGPGREAAPRPRSWADHMAGIHEEFDKAKKPAVEH